MPIGFYMFIAMFGFLGIVISYLNSKNKQREKKATELSLKLSGLIDSYNSKVSQAQMMTKDKIDEAKKNNDYHMLNKIDNIEQSFQKEMLAAKDMIESINGDNFKKHSLAEIREKCYHIGVCIGQMNTQLKLLDSLKAEPPGMNYSGYIDDEPEEEENTYKYEKKKEKKNPIDVMKQTKFFNGVSDKNSLDQRYKQLAKVYHPDSGNGSAQIFGEITDEYNILKEFFAEMC